MIGMYAKVTEENGISAGWIDTIKVKDGKISAVLADQDGNKIGEYELAKISEITYATIGNGSENDNKDNVSDEDKPAEEPEQVEEKENV